MSFRNILDTIMFAILLIGGINWGLVGGFNFDLVAYIFGTATAPSKLIYLLVGLATIYVFIRQLTRRNT